MLQVSEEELAERKAALDDYMTSIIHTWSKTLTALGFLLVPIFFILDWFMMPAELLPRFAVYRFVGTALDVCPTR